MSIGVSLQDVWKKYGDTTVLCGISADFEAGMIHGVMGRNGSGKTVLFKCISGFSPVSSGAIHVFGRAVRSYSAQNIGLILEEPGFLNAYSAYDNLRFLSCLRGKRSRDELEAILDTVGLDPKSKKHVSAFSLGMRHRLAIAQAIVDRPPLLILDEPMNGLDRSGVKEISAVLRTLRESGTTILLSSHYIEDLKDLSDELWQMETGTLNRL